MMAALEENLGAASCTCEGIGLVQAGTGRRREDALLAGGRPHSLPSALLWLSSDKCKCPFMNIPGGLICVSRPWRSSGPPRDEGFLPGAPCRPSGPLARSSDHLGARSSRSAFFSALQARRWWGSTSPARSRWKKTSGIWQEVRGGAGGAACGAEGKPGELRRGQPESRGGFSKGAVKAGSISFLGGGFQPAPFINPAVLLHPARPHQPHRCAFALAEKSRTAGGATKRDDQSNYRPLQRRHRSGVPVASLTSLPRL